MLDADLPADWPVADFSSAVFFQEGPGLRNWQYRPTGVPFVNIRCLINGRLDRAAMTCLDPQEVETKYRHFLLDPGDYVVSSSGTLGRIAEVRAEDQPCMLNTSVIRMRPKSDALDRRFLKYFLLSELYQQQILAFAAGSVQANYGPSHLRQMKIVLPPLAEQRAVAETLSSLDDKIELNRRMNETLEAMAQAVFRDWFVDFGPVRRKLAGETDPVAIMGSLAPDPARTVELAALFPSALGEDGLPEGWRECPIGDQTEITGGSTPSTADESLWQPPEHRWATPKDLSSMADLALFETGRRISSAGLAKITSGLLPAGTVLLSSRAPIGYLAIAQEPVAINQGFIALKPSAVLGSAYLYLWCKANMEAILANANGSTFQEISKKNFRPITSAVPANPAILRAFGDIAQPLIERIVAAARENRTLAETRDYLLPRLMSGAVRVRREQTQDAAA